MQTPSRYLRFSILAGISSISAFGHSYGPPPRVTAGPGDNARACTACHTTNLLNSGPGGVKILLQSGPFYIPGVKQRVMVQVADPNQKRWGFELSARLNSEPQNGQAGSLTPVDNMTQVICADYGPTPCASGPAFITHTSVGTRNGTAGGAIFQFDWTPPPADAGPVTLFVASNAANGDGSPVGDQIYTSNVQLTAAIPATPSLTAGTLINAATGQPGPVAPNSWVTVYGSNLGVTTRSFADSDFVNGELPFSLDGVSVLLTITGGFRLAYVGYVSPTQINFLLPSDLSSAPSVQIKNPAGISNSLPMMVAATAGQLFTLDGTNVWATHADGTFVAHTGANSATSAAPGETITLYGTGLGATSPALIPGVLPAAAANLVTLPKATIGGAPATVVSGNVVPGAACLYQVVVQVPTNAANGDLPVALQIGAASSVPVMLAVQN